MSKSIGNVIEPTALLNDYTVDAVRTYFLAKGPLTRDASFSHDHLKDVHNDFIVDTYLNLVQRVLSPKKLTQQLTFPVRRPAVMQQEYIDYMDSVQDKLKVDHIERLIRDLRYDELFEVIKEVLESANAWLS